MYERKRFPLTEASKPSSVISEQSLCDASQAPVLPTRAVGTTIQCEPAQAVGEVSQSRSVYANAQLIRRFAVESTRYYGRLQG